jgi:hypothetical protein
MRETYPPILLQRKTNRLKKETGNPNLRSAMASPLTPRDLFLRAIVRPTKLLFLSPIVFALSTFMGVAYGYLYLLFTTITPVFEGQYHFSQGTVGLTFLGIGIGSLAGLAIFGIASDRILKHMAKKGEMKPEYRLPPLVPGGLLIPIGLFWYILSTYLSLLGYANACGCRYGWSADQKVHWIMPIIGTMFVGLGLMATFVSLLPYTSFPKAPATLYPLPKIKQNPQKRLLKHSSLSLSNPNNIQMPINTYLVDAFTLHAASALAASTVLRSLMGALLPLAGRRMYQALGLGWGNSLLAFIALAFAPMTWVLFKYGERIRKHPKFQLNL